MGARDVGLGIGTGLLLATLIFGAADQMHLAEKFGWSSSAPVSAATAMDASQDKQAPATDWKQEAAKAGMTVLPKAEYDQKLEQARADGAKQEAAKAGMTVLPKAEYDQKLEQARADGAKQKADELASKGPDKVFVYIQPGMGTNDVALLLQAAGVLTDGNQLIQLRQNQRNPIRAGTYQLPLKADPQEIIKTIATPPQK